MATKEEIIAGLEMTVSQAKRTTSLFAEGEYDWKRAGGWTPKEMYVHLAAVAIGAADGAPWNQANGLLTKREPLRP